MPADYDTVIEQVIEEPRSATVDGQTVTNHSPIELMEAVRKAESRDALAGVNSNGGRLGGWGGAIRERVKPPGGAE
ncbi:MAG: hypothetical protein EKK55_03635 [Rhodocyclaceae bacterium]|nr:MAG: hypothetical protein EKK55_03635 [Rhodocyclaceae bacterium]